MRFGVCYLLLGILIPSRILASDQTGPYVGGGLGYDNLTLTTPNKETSRFNSQGYVVEGGYKFKFGGIIGLDMGRTNLINKLTSRTYLENGTLNSKGVRLGYSFGRLTIGAGYRRSTIVMKSVSLDKNIYLESNYEGRTPYTYLELNSPITKKIYAGLEAQYLTGQFQSENSNLPNLRINRFSIIMKLSYHFD